MEEKPYSFQKFSLTDLALRTVVVNLWNASDILSAIAKVRFKSMTYTRIRNVFEEAVESKVKDKMSKLELPVTLKKEIMILLKPIGSEIRNWKIYHEKFVSLENGDMDVSVLEKLCWTSSGTIDYGKTAAELVRCEMVNLVNRYKLACVYCLEDDIRRIWGGFPEKIKNAFYNAEGVPNVESPFLPFFWPYILLGEERKLNTLRGRPASADSSTFNQYTFENLANSGNKAAAEYFFHKLTPAEKEGTLVRTAHNVVVYRNIEFDEKPENSEMEKHSEVLCYLLSLMTSEQQMEILKHRPPQFLRCFLDWPFHDHFSKLAGLIWDFVTEDDYDILLWNMIHASIRTGYFIPKLFQEFYTQSPIDFKKYFVHRSRMFFDFFSIFVNNGDSESIKLIFRSVDIEDRSKLLSSYKFYNIIDDLIMAGKFQLAELCLHEASFSKENKDGLKKTFMNFLDEDGKIIPTEWRRFFRLIDASETNKRSLEEEIPAEAKRTAARIEEYLTAKGYIWK